MNHLCLPDGEFAAYLETITVQNTQAGFRGLAEYILILRPWVSQAPHNPADIACHQGSSPTPIFSNSCSIGKNEKRY